MDQGALESSGPVRQLAPEVRAGHAHHLDRADRADRAPQEDPADPALLGSPWDRQALVDRSCQDGQEALQAQLVLVVLADQLVQEHLGAQAVH